MLKCVSRFRNSFCQYDVGDIVVLSPDEEAQVLRESPASFVRYEEPAPVTEVIHAPPVVKVIEAPKTVVEPVVTVIEAPVQHRAVTRTTRVTRRSPTADYLSAQEVDEGAS